MSFTLFKKKPQVHRAAEPKPAATAQEKKPKQWGVRIAAPDPKQACMPVRKYLNKEFTLGQKPQLPVADCPFSHNCACHYVPLLDRRKSERRQPGDRRGAQRFDEKTPRRSGRDRRKDRDIDWS